MSAPGIKITGKTICSLLLPASVLLSAFVSAAPATFDENTRELVTACVEPQIAGQTALRKSDNEPKTHTVTMVFNEDYSVATATAASRVTDATDCTATFELTTGVYSDQIMYNGVPTDISLKFTGGLSFSVISFPLPEQVEPAQTSLWRVSNGTNELFIGGVVNFSLVEFWTSGLGSLGNLGIDVTGVDILRDSDFPLPAAFEEAYDLSNAIVTLFTPFEYNNKFTTLNGLVGQQATLDTVLSSDVYADLDQWFMGAFGADTAGAGASQIRPVWIADLVKWVTAKLSYGYGTGVETYFQNKAGADFKTNWGLEEADDGMVAININSVDWDLNKVVADALAEVNSPDFKANIDALLDAWRNGDDDYLYNALVKADAEGDLQDFTRFYTDRFENWMPVFEDLIESAPKEFLLLDVRYLVGPDSFLAYLEAAGYTVERY